MGAVNSSSMKAVTDILQQETINIMTKNSQRANADLRISQEIIVDISDMKNCIFSSIQTIKATQEIKAVVTIQTTSDLQATMTAAVQNSMANTQSSMQSFLASAFADQSSEQEIITNIKSIISANVTTDNTTEILATIKTIQSGNYKLRHIDCGHETFIISQAVIVSQVASMIVNSTTSALMKMDQIANAVNTITNDQSIVQKGVAEAISAFGLAILTPLLLIGGVIMLPQLLKGGGSTGKGGQTLQLGNIASMVEKNPEMLAFNMKGTCGRKLRLNCCN